MIRMPYVFYAAAGSIIGFMGVGGSIEMVALTTLIPLGYFFLLNRFHLFALLLSYRLTVSHGVLFGIFNYEMSGYVLGFVAWIVTALLTTLPWILIWSPRLNHRFFLLPVVLAVTILPPIGFFDFANPIVSAGLFFPGTGYIGIVLYVGMLYAFGWGGVKVSEPQRWAISTGVLGLFAVGTHVQPLDTSAFLYPMQTHYSFERAHCLTDVQRRAHLFGTIKKVGTKSILLPERIFGDLQKNKTYLWEELPTKTSILGGAYIHDGERYTNALLLLRPEGYTTLYTQRVPIPFSMWNPFSDRGAVADIHSHGIAHFHGKKLGILICYELNIPYLYLETLYGHPDYLVAISNLWWSRSPFTERGQHHALLLWSRLFGVPYFYSVNGYYGR